ncbi:MAG: DUF1802 family protein [Gemmataceae bacterium]
MLAHAFKEWAVICRALELGRQAILLRKGGIAEDAGVFQLEHKRFWLYPTYVHQQRAGIKEEALALLAEVEQQRPAAGKIRLSHFAEAVGIYHLHDLPAALMLQSMHSWSEATVAQRFHYRAPGLFVVAVRVFQVAEAIELDETEQYAGCKSWVELERPLETAGATPALDDAAFHDLLRKLDDFLNPTAFA